MGRLRFHLQLQILIGTGWLAESLLRRQEIWFDLWTPLTVDLDFDRILKVILYAATERLNSSIRVLLLHADGTFITGHVEV